MQSECLKEAFSELDMTSEVLQILMSPDNPYFRLSTFGHAGSTHVSSVIVLIYVSQWCDLKVKKCIHQLELDELEEFFVYCSIYKEYINYRIQAEAMTRRTTYKGALKIEILHWHIDHLFFSCRPLSFV